VSENVDLKDTDILKHIEELDNIQGYIKALIRADIAAQAGKGSSPEETPAE
jgi:hypothetical protein